MDKKKVNLTVLDQFFNEAARTDRRLPNVIKHQKMSSWVDYNKLDWLDKGYNSRKIVVRPTGRQITRWWFSQIILLEFVEDQDMRKLIWLRAKRYPWTHIGRALALDRRKAKNKYEEELIYLSMLLETNRRDKRIVDIIDKILY